MPIGWSELRVYNNITLRDGGVLAIEISVIEKWQKIFPNINFNEFDKMIEALDANVNFSKCNKNKAIKIIKETLHSLNLR